MALLFEGSITVESELNKGSIFTLLIKKNIKEENFEYVIPEIKINEEKILIVNNNPSYYFEIIVKLKKKYQIVKQLSSFANLLENLKENYSKIFIDMNCVSEEELIKILKVEKFNLYIICDNKELLDEYLKSNCVMIFEKPFDKELLLTC